ncbi:hypothetical protein N824_17690 [Pedobacter sp. V48]|nr:hypothetical protein N824_17690 [Pedobacter sp. V48]
MNWSNRDLQGNSLYVSGNGIMINNKSRLNLIKRLFYIRLNEPFGF